MQAADECGSAGLILPVLPNRIKDELKSFLPIAGSIFKNPVDMSGVHSFQDMTRSIKLVGGWSEVDLLILHIGVEIGPNAMMKVNVLEPVADVFIRCSQRSRQTGRSGRLCLLWCRDLSADN